MPAPSGSSLIDWVDAADEPIAQVRRSEVFERRAGFRVAHVFVFNPQDELLLQQLGSHRERNSLRWGSSVAAYLFSGESYLEAAQRRMKDEIGLSAKLVKFGSTAMLDQGARKFITLYVSATSSVEIGDTGHIESLRFVRIPEIQAWLQRAPDDFTETFRFLFRFYLSTLSLMNA